MACNPRTGRLSWYYTLPKGDLEEVAIGYPHSSRLSVDKLTTGCSLYSYPEKIYTHIVLKRKLPINLK